MNGIYYKIWADAITSFQIHYPNRVDWKFTLFNFITFIHSLNWWIICLWLKYFNVFEIAILDIDIFQGNIIDGFIAYFMTFILPFIPINFFLVFFNDRYKKIIAENSSMKFKWAFWYSCIVPVLALFSGILYGILS